MRMGEVLRKERACSLDGRMAGLNYLLRERKIMPHEEVEVWRFVALVEGHRDSPVKRGIDFNLIGVYAGFADL
jgi:hypothetical protein